jgi:myo-inositol catabolism protein IolC
MTAWQPRHDDPLFILAMDHRASFGKTLFAVKDDNPDHAQLAAMKAAKSLIFEGLSLAAPKLTSGRAGVLVDEQYGEAVIEAARKTSTPVVLAVPVEASGHDWFTLQWGADWVEHVEQVKPDYAKVLVRVVPDQDLGGVGLDLLDVLHPVGTPLQGEPVVAARLDRQERATGRPR